MLKHVRMMVAHLQRNEQGRKRCRSVIDHKLLSSYVHMCLCMRCRTNEDCGRNVT